LECGGKARPWSRRRRPGPGRGGRGHRDLRQLGARSARRQPDPVQSAVYDRFVERLCALAESQRLGDPRDSTTQLGPLASEEQFTHASAYLDLVPGDGGEILTGGLADDGWFIRPTVMSGVPSTSAVWRDEVFAPVGAVTRFEDEDEAVALARQRVRAIRRRLHTDRRATLSPAARRRGGLGKHVGRARPASAARRVQAVQSKAARTEFHRTLTIFMSLS
jgi:acyl-CoA reductase-like NAD-dependent aldehyde dehydrogenase